MDYFTERPAKRGTDAWHRNGPPHFTTNQEEGARASPAHMAASLRNHIESLNSHCASGGGAFSQFKLDDDTVSIHVQAEGCKGAIVFRIATCYKTTAESVEEEHGTHVCKLAR